MIFNRKFALIIFFLLIIFESICQPNDEITSKKGKTYRNFNGEHSIIEVIPVSGTDMQVRNIILMIGDGMGASQVYSGLVANKGSLYLSKFPVTGLAKTNSASGLITDSSAGATALATGKKTRNGYVGIDTNRKPLETILEYCEKKGLSTGLVATSSITHATPASFIAHVMSRDLNEDIAAHFLKTEVDIFIGGGRDFFNARTDGINLIEALKAKNYKVLYSTEELNEIDTGKVAGLLWKEHGPSVLSGRGDMLAISTRKSIELLNQNKNGFFLMVEGSQIDWGGHQNDTRYLTEEMLDFDIAIGEAVRFAAIDGNTLVIVTADHETGGFAVTGGRIQKGEVAGSFLTDGHTAVWVPVFAFGPGEGKFTGIYENSDIYFKMRELLESGIEK
ncbi:MAG TPA: alkaline phosphatase [Cyclobacteriaceae bacterium]|nr:alkaline phosphatase [Cyclobacteriaceae bacterium]